MSKTLYKENIIDHYKKPRNLGKLSNATNSASIDNSSCGDQIKVWIIVEENCIKDIKFQAEGCAISIAAMSMVSNKLKGMSVNDYQKIDYKFVLDLIGMEETSGRFKCATLCLNAIDEALNIKRL